MEYYVFVADKKHGEIHSELFVGNIKSSECEDFIDSVGKEYCDGEEYYWAIYDCSIGYEKCYEDFQQCIGSFKRGFYAIS